jgi:uncharacterized protein
VTKDSSPTEPSDLRELTAGWRDLSDRAAGRPRRQLIEWPGTFPRGAIRLLSLLRPLAGALLAVLTLGTMPAAPAHAGPAAPAEHDQVSVTGEGRVPVIPDIMIVRAGVEVRAPDAVQAYRATAAAATRLIRALAEAGVAERDVRTAELWVQPEYGTGPRPEITGYHGTEKLTVTVRELAGAPGTLRSLMNVPAALLYGVSFEKADLSAEYAAAEELAFADARGRALRQSRLAGRELGRVMSISTQRGDAQPMRVLTKEAVAAADGHLSPGEGTLWVTANLVYALA